MTCTKVCLLRVVIILSAAWSRLFVVLLVVKGGVCGAPAYLLQSLVQSQRNGS